MAKKSREPRNLSHDDLTTWGSDMVNWLADHAADLGSGVYLVRCTSAGFSESKMIIYLK